MTCHIRQPSPFVDLSLIRFALSDIFFNWLEKKDEKRAAAFQWQHVRFMFFFNAMFLFVQWIANWPIYYARWKVAFVEHKSHGVLVVFFFAVVRIDSF